VRKATAMIATATIAAPSAAMITTPSTMANAPSNVHFDAPSNDDNDNAPPWAVPIINPYSAPCMVINPYSAPHQPTVIPIVNDIFVFHPMQQQPLPSLLLVLLPTLPILLRVLLPTISIWILVYHLLFCLRPLCPMMIMTKLTMMLPLNHLSPNHILLGWQTSCAMWPLVSSCLLCAY
jgi:hypothetical protein